MRILVGRKFVRRAKKVQSSRGPDRLANGALTRLFGAGNEAAADGGWVSEQELILADAELRPELYQSIAKTVEGKMNPPRKHGPYKRSPR